MKVRNLCTETGVLNIQALYLKDFTKLVMWHFWISEKFVDCFGNIGIISN
jgi:hypothetical protein